MKMRCLAYLIAAAAALSCSEKIDVHVKDMDKVFLTVEGFLTDDPKNMQTITLSESTGFFANDTVPMVHGAVVTVDDGESQVRYEEGSPGVYAAPKGFHGVPGHTYHLSIEAEIAGEKRSYEAVSTMPEPGFQIDSIDYAYTGLMSADSTWTIAMWGKDAPTTDYFLASMTVNGYLYPFAIPMFMDDKYFAGQQITAFPVAVLMQTAQNQKMYGPCCKFLEPGDVITFSALTLRKDCYDFFFSYSSNLTGSSIPFFSSQPANCPTNVTGGDAMGYFAACPVCTASVVVDDPFKPSLGHQPLSPAHAVSPDQ